MRKSTSGRTRRKPRRQASVIAVARLLASNPREVLLPSGSRVKIGGMTIPKTVERYEEMTVYLVRDKGGTTHEIDSGKISDSMCAYVFEQGLHKLCNGRGFSKVGAKNTFADADAYAKVATEIFLKNVDDLYNDRTKRVGGTTKAKAKGEEAKLKAEMKRLARVDGDSMLKAAGHAISKVSTATKNEVADALIAQDPEKYKKAALANLAEAAKLAAAVGDMDALGITVKLDEKKVAASEKSKAAAKAKKEAKAKEKAAAGSAPPPKATAARGPQRSAARH